MLQKHVTTLTLPNGTCAKGLRRINENTIQYNHFMAIFGSFPEYNIFTHFFSTSLKENTFFAMGSWAIRL